MISIHMAQAFLFGACTPVLVFTNLDLTSHLRIVPSSGICKSVDLLNLRHGTDRRFFDRSQAIRTIFFNTASNLVQNAGVMVGWISLSCGTTLVFTWWMRKRELRALQLDETTSIPERLSRELAAQAQEEEK